MDAIPDDETAELQREEVQALEAIFEGALDLRSPRSDEGLPQFPIVYRINLNDMDAESCCPDDGTTNWPKRPLAVEIRYPSHYPSDDDGDGIDPTRTVPSFALVHENTVLEFPSSASEQLLAILRETARSERGMPSVLSCLYAAREFLDGAREWEEPERGSSEGNKSANTSSSGAVASHPTEGETRKTVYACLSTHHLLDHKPDNLLKTGHKSGLSGFYKFGTPGLAVAWGDPEDIEDFCDTLRRAMPQKKFELRFHRSWELCDPIPVGWTSVDPPALKEALAAVGAPQEDYYTALGIEPREDHGGKSKGKGKNK